MHQIIAKSPRKLAILMITEPIATGSWLVGLSPSGGGGASGKIFGEVEPRGRFGSNRRGTPRERTGRKEKIAPRR